MKSEVPIYTINKTSILSHKHSIIGTVYYIPRLYHTHIIISFIDKISNNAQENIKHKSPYFIIKCYIFY